MFDNKAPDGARDDLFALIRECSNLDWQLLTKRPENYDRYLPRDWGIGYDNVWLGITAEDQQAYDRRWAILSQTPARFKFISYEPAIGPLSLDSFTSYPDWLIWGGESGPGARTMNPQWARDITGECLRHGVAVFGKQWGTYRSNPEVFENLLSIGEAETLDPKTLLDGELYRDFPISSHMAAQGALF